MSTEDIDRVRRIALLEAARIAAEVGEKEERLAHPHQKETVAWVARLIVQALNEASKS